MKSVAGDVYEADTRSHEEDIEFWDGLIESEPITPDTIPWERHLVNNAANPLHIERTLGLGRRGIGTRYKVAWVGANVLYERAKLLDVGGFSWWARMPPNHAGEEAVVQFLLLHAYGGCSVLPSGTYHVGLPTTIADRTHNCTALFGELVEEWRASQLRRSA